MEASRDGAHMGSVVVDLAARNPGDWRPHCSQAMHVDGGVISRVKVG